MTHGAIYDLSPAIRAVLHVHAPEIFAPQVRARLRIPTTRDGVDYGTPEMASEMARLWKDTALPDRRVLVMAGHEDGVVAFGADADDAGAALMSAFAAALSAP